MVRLGWTKLLAALSCALMSVVSGCRVGGDLTAAPVAAPPMAPIVLVPTITTPAVSPYYSNSSSLTITGMCNEGDWVTLAGDASDRQQCVGSSFSFSVSKSTDGLYTFLVTQTDSTDAVSAPASAVWVRKTSVSAPLISTPSATPFASSQATLTLSGSCESGAVISLSNGLVASTPCSASTFSFSIPKSVDSDYTFVVTQTDPAGNSASSNLVWKKHALSATPLNPSLVVMSSQGFTLSGGSESYSMSVVTNNSGGALDAVQRVYIPGTLANVVDTLRVTDSLGASQDIQVSTVAGAADHLEIAGGDSQTQTIGNLLTTKPKVRVVDRYGNGVAGENVYFQVMNGDAEIVGLPIQLSDAQGYVQVDVRMGHSALNSSIRATRFAAALPDLALTGRSSVTLVETSKVNSTKAKFGTAYDVGVSPVATIYGDFDGDGKKDVAVLSNSDSRINVMLGIGSGLFGSILNYNTCTDPVGILSADLNGDGKSDLAVVCNSSESIRVFLGVGDGTFTPLTSFQTATTPAAIVAGDIDQDGKMDLAVVSRSGNFVRVHYGNGNGTFTVLADFPTGIGPAGLALGDFNKDGASDLVVSNSVDNTIRVFINSKSGTASRSTNFGSGSDYGAGVQPEALLVGDFNGDGWQDVISANRADATVSVFFNLKNGTGSLDVGLATNVGTDPTSIAAADVNGDGYPDLVVANTGENMVGVLLGLNPSLGMGQFDNMVNFLAGGNPTGVSLGDGNGDGYPDVIFVNSADNTLEFQTSDGAGNLGYLTQVGVNPVAVRAGDFDGDGVLDLAVASTGSKTIRILKGSGIGLFTVGASLGTANNPSGLAVADLNADGFLDIVVTHAGSSSVGVFLGKGDGTFQARVDYNVGTSPMSVVIADFNRDGVPDLAVVSSSDNAVNVLLGIGNGTFQVRVNYPTGAQPQRIAVAEFNGDGLLDLAVTNASDGSVSVLLGNGNGTFQTRVDYPTGLGPSLLLTGDFNGDGIEDLLVSNSIDGSVSYIRGNGDGSFKTPSSYSTGTTASGMAIGDFDGDGKLDIAVTYGSAGGFGILKGNGAGGFPSIATYQSTQNSALIAKDVSSDGRVDLVILDISQDAVQIWLGR